MASRLHNPFKVPQRAEETQESIPSNNEKQRSVWSPGTRVVGKYDFKGETADDLPFRKGEILVIDGVTSVPDPNWYEAVNCEGRKGWIPRNFVMERYPVELKPMSWFHGNISRRRAEWLLHRCEDGMFLIRNSSNYQGDYALSVCYGNKIEHYRIRKTDDGKLTVDDEVFFGSLFEFVEHYSRSANELRMRLVKPMCGETAFYDSVQSSLNEGGWEIDRSCLYSRDCIRRGDFGDIFQAEYLDQKVAVKIYSAERYQDVQAFLLEAAIMTNLQHRNIVTLFGVSLAENPLYLVTEFCAKVSILTPWENLLLIEKLQVS